ncbi:Uncharacterised protein [Amycolatopsis camponoti]|uniref:Uncharacterized protein n=1 Tax=Amycolatopsis camponoti TaxID=2606593 RepID=A0A6I8LWJ2_9PSEU|nr:hypothetical protein [Amycolatopsis camponoti]VVJ21500.1 Uncharacterised protein [Amycolatopsis camponoti]
MNAGAVIYMDPQAIHPVINGEWHRLAGVLEPGQEFTTLCGISDTATFLPFSERRTRGSPKQCEGCDVIYRRDNGIPLLHDRLGRRA